MQNDVSPLKRTPLFACHQSAGAKLTPFAGWEMPVQYSGLVDEHNTVREKAGIFDVSHMGEITVRGPNAFAFLQYLTSNDVSKLAPGKAQYSLLLNDRGGVVDDIIVYQLAEQDYLLCVNAGNTDKDWEWIQRHNIHGAEIANVSAQWAQIALQGPVAMTILAQLLRETESELSAAQFPPFTVRSVTWEGSEILIARTGYTGEDGVEIFCLAELSPRLWNKLLELGGAHGLKPAGLGARDTLRLEACYPLHGHELSDDITALESGLGWVVKLDKGDFIGRDALAKQKAEGLKRRLVGFELIDRGIVRGEAPVLSPTGERIGMTSSGTMTPTLNRALGLAFVSVEYAAAGTELAAEVRGKPLKIRVAKTPFYKRQ